MKTHEETSTEIYKKIPPHRESYLRQGVLNKVSRTLRQNPSTSVPTIASKIKLPSSTVQYGKKTILVIREYKKKVVSKYNGDKKKRAKTNLRKIHKSGGSNVLIIFDETYVPFDLQNAVKQGYFHS